MSKAADEIPEDKRGTKPLGFFIGMALCGVAWQFAKQALGYSPDWAGLFHGVYWVGVCAVAVRIGWLRAD